jgi:hypothetical protein
MVAREEAHRLIDYRTCLRQIYNVLRLINPTVDVEEMSSEDYSRLYEMMASGELVPGWDYTAYSNPAYFLYILRRHAVTAAFGHARYGGNVGAAGWAYLETSKRFSDPKPGATLFDWRPALEPPESFPPAPRAEQMETDFDVVIIGSGAGGAPVAKRLVQAGHRVLVLCRRSAKASASPGGTTDSTNSACAAISSSLAESSRPGVHGPRSPGCVL